MRNLLPLLGIALMLAGFVGAVWRLLQHPQGFNLILLGVLILGALRIIWEFTVNRGRVPTIATNRRVRAKIAALLAAADLPPGAQLLDLGCGRGELARTIAQAMPQVQVLGIEYNRAPYVLARLQQQLLGPANLRFQQGDLFAHDCSHAAAVTLFVGKLTAVVAAKLKNELAPGTWVISVDFPLPDDWQLQDSHAIHTPYKTVVYLYRR